MAYASLVSLTNTLDENIQLNLIPPNSQYIQTLLQEASFFQEFIENSSNKSSKTAKYLESRIRDVAYTALDIIDSHVADQLLEKSDTGDEVCFRSIWRILRSICSSIPESNQSFTSLFQKLDKLMKEINSIKQDVMQIAEKEKDNTEEEENNDEPLVQSIISLAAGSSRPPSHGMTTNTMVGLDDQLKEIKTRLISGSSQREIVALVGMGGIGKTTLARKVYDDKFIISRFDTRRWVTVSHEYSMQSIIAGLLGREKMIQENNENLKLVLYQSLKNMRYLIVLDDMWDTKVWEGLKRVLPDDNNGSRILLTTRLDQVAKHENSCPPEYMRFLDNKESWGLFCEVFERDCFPPELEKVGKEIVKNCRGLPLAIKVIGGHLSKATRTPQYWRSVAKKLSETIASEDDDQCSQVLSLSYKHLLHNLKGYFLYMSIFPEDYEIEVSVLVHLWIASGLIKEERSKSFEHVAKDYIVDLVERNLILGSNSRYDGKIFGCQIHDLIRDLCIKKAKSEKFFHLTDKTLYRDFGYVDDRADVFLHSMPLRALYLNRMRTEFMATVDDLITNNIRFLYCVRDLGANEIALSTHKFMHLHTIDVIGHLTLNIWEMPQLRHVKVAPSVIVPDPPPPPSKIEGGNSVIVLEKLETLYYLKNFIFTDEVLQRIQNIKSLGVEYHATKSRDFGLNSLECLSKLESLRCLFYSDAPVVSIHDLSFPPSIKKLTLRKTEFPWKDMTVVGS